MYLCTALSGYAVQGCTEMYKCQVVNCSACGGVAMFSGRLKPHLTSEYTRYLTAPAVMFLAKSFDDELKGELCYKLSCGRDS